MAVFEFCNKSPREVEENKEDIRLIYLDCDLHNINEVEEIMLKLKALNRAAQCYTDSHSCLEFIKSTRNERLFVIVSDRVSSKNLLRISVAVSVVAIFILSTTNDHRLSKTENNKIIDICTDLGLLITSIRKIMRLAQKDTLAFRLFDQKQKSLRDLTNESISFLWYQLLIHVLKQIPNEHESKQEMLAMCYEYYKADPKELKKIKKFEETYTPETAISWYTDECFLYKLLNRALRTEDISLLYIFRFFIIDLCNEIEANSHNATEDDSMTLYRGQVIPDDEINQLKGKKGNIISFNGFVSTTRTKRIALAFGEHHPSSDNLQHVLFEIKADRSLTTARFADVTDKSCHEEEEEVLFTLNACFKLISIDFDSRHKRWNVQLEATNEASNKFQEYLVSIEEQISEYTPLIYYGRLALYEFGRVEQAKDYFDRLKRLLPANHSTMASVYDHLGHVNNHRDELNLALENYKRAYRIYNEKVPLHYPYIARSLRYLGTIYERKGDLETALEYFKEARLMHKQHSPDDHLEKALALESIGITYRAKHDLEMALKSLFCALTLYRRALPDPHRHIAQCLGYLGLVHEDMNELKKALDYYQKQLEMEEECLPADHWHIYLHIGWIVHIKIKMNHRDEAWKYCEEKYTHARRTLGTTHPRVAQICMIMAELIEDDNPQQAFDFYNKAVSILNTSSKPDDRLLSQCYLAMANWCNKYNMLDDALQYDQKAVILQRQCLPSDHIDLGFSLKNLGISLRAVNRVMEANDCFSKSLSTYQANYGSEHIAMKLYNRMVTELIEQGSETSRSKPQQQYISAVTDHKNKLTSPQQSLELAQSITKSPSNMTKRTSSTCVIL